MFLPGGSAALPPAVTVGPAASATATLTLQTPISAGAQRFPFRVVASTGRSVMPPMVPSTITTRPIPAARRQRLSAAAGQRNTESAVARGAAAQLPFRVRVANTGTAIDRYWLTPNAYPGNWTMAIDPLETYVPPGQTTDFYRHPDAAKHRQHRHSERCREPVANFCDAERDDSAGQRRQQRRRTQHQPGVRHPRHTLCGNGNQPGPAVTPLILRYPGRSVPP